MKNHYRRISRTETRARIARAIEAEFRRLNLEAIANGKPDAIKLKVTPSLITAVEEAMRSRTIIPDEIELGSWLTRDEEGRVVGGERKEWITTASGILKINELLSGDDDYLIPWSPDWFSTVCLPYPFDWDATCPRWTAFLERNLEGDRERIDLLQEWAGYLLTPCTDQQKFLILEGEGANGKSVYLAAIEAMLGVENCSHVPLEIFGQRFALTQTLNKLANIAADCGEIDHVSEGYLKSFTSGDRMMFDRKGIPAIEASPTARLMLSTNNRPRFSDKSSGVWRRMLLVPFRVEIAEEEKIHGMDKVEWWNRSGELPGILNWALAGLQRLRSRGRFTISEAMREIIREYRLESNPARQFLEERYEADADGLEETASIYSRYRKWCEENGYKPLADKSFSREIKRCFRKVERIKIGPRGGQKYHYRGIRELSESNPEGESVYENRDDLF